MRRARASRAALLFIVLAAIVAAPEVVRAAPPRPGARAAKSEEAGSWARANLARLTLAEKVGQMIGVRAPAVSSPDAARETRRLRRQVALTKVGTVVIFESELQSLPGYLAALQDLAKVPLLIAGDLERGMSFRMQQGVVPLPYAMAIGATRSEEAARFTGEVTAREARALGIHWALAPVVDVNSNPDNPVINIRSYGEDAQLVARLARAFVEGAQDQGLLTTAKHFPGHGDTATDSHLQLATVEAARERLNAVELLPFRTLVGAGVDWVMMGHIAAPALDPSRTPATLSSPVAHVLRHDLGFQGPIVTDGLDMAAVRSRRSGEAAVRAVEAGADVILLPPRPEAAAAALLAAVTSGRVSRARIDASVLRILQIKERVGLGRGRTVDAREVGRSVARPEDLARAEAVARESITVVKNEGGVLPLRAEEPLRLLHLVFTASDGPAAAARRPEEELARRRIVSETVTVGPAVTEATTADLEARAAAATHVVVSSFLRVSGAKGSATMTEGHARLVRSLVSTERPVIVLSFDSPYLLRQVPEVAAYVAAYGAAESSQRAALAALFGEFRVSGKLPVSLPGLYAYGHGLELPRREMTLRPGASAEVGFRPSGLEAADAVVERGVANRAFPGAVLAVGKDGALVRLRPFGRIDYGVDAQAVQADTLYDLASLTKIVATTTMAMILVDEGKLDLARPVASFLPGFSGGAKDRVTVEQLLTHSGGLDWWGPLYKELKGPEAYLRRIESMDLAYEPGTKSLYSDLGVFLLGAVLERAAGESLEGFVKRRVLEPLSMKDTLYRPGLELLPRIAPTEDDPWRGRLLRGEVHDENAYALGGLAPHAGLFGSAGDLARYAQMLQNGGVLEHHRIVSRATVERFTRRAGVPGSSRALGFDTPWKGSGPRSSVPGAEGYSSAGSRFSQRAFGHTGFTGTSLWIDPERRLFVVLLTNRVHPTRQNDRIREVRADLADAVVRALADPSVP